MRLLSIGLFFLLPSLLSAQSLPWPAESPFQDSYGYSWKTNSAADGPDFDWVDIVGVGEMVDGLGDEGIAGPFDLGMSFPFYWGEYNQIWIGANGFASLDGGIPISPTGNGFPLLPSSLLPNSLLAPYMADLTGGGTNNPGQIWWYNDSANQRFVLSWINWPYFSSQNAGYAGSNTFQLILQASDSSIVFQYLSMNGNWDPAYDQILYPFVTGIENQSGNMGLMPHSLPINDSLRPTDSTAIQFIRPSSPRIPIPDLAISWADNPASAAVFLPWSPPLSLGWRAAQQLTAQVENSGLESINQTFGVRTWVKNAQNQVIFSRNKTLPSLPQGSERYLVYYDHFDPPQAGTFMQQSFVENSSTYGDLNINNDTMSTELIFLDTTEQEHWLSYEQTDEQSPLFLYEGTAAGAWFEPYGYPVEVKALEFYLFLTAGSSPSSGFSAKVYRMNSLQLPDSLLFEKQVPIAEVVLPSGWTRIDLPQPIRIDSGGFFVSWEQIDQGLRLLTDRQAPLARRSFDSRDGIWRTALGRYKEDLMIRALVDHKGAVATVSNDRTAISQINWMLYPNPVQEGLQLEIVVPNPTEISLLVLDGMGKEVWKEVALVQVELHQSLDLSHLPEGIYLFQLQSPYGILHKKILIAR